MVNAMNEVKDFLYSHINTKRAMQCKPLELQKRSDPAGDIEEVHEYTLTAPYPTEKIAPSVIQVGIKSGRICIRVDERERKDRMKFNDYFADDLGSMKGFFRHIVRIQRDYDRSTWFIRAQLIPSLLRKVLDLSEKTHAY